MAGVLTRARSRRTAVAVAAVALGAVISPMSPARATYPGSNGRISFTREANNCWDLLSVKTGTTGSAKYTNCAGQSGASAWSPDGKTLAAGLMVGNENALFLRTIDAATGSQIRVAGANKPADDPYWSPDGKTLVYVSDVTGFGAYQNVYKIPAAGGTPTKLTNFASGSGHLVADPEFSPDGTKIVYEDTPPPGGSPTQIWVMGAGGQTPTQLATTLSGSSISPTWSPDGTKIAFANNSSGNFDIYTMAADGSGPAVIAGATSADETMPVWSPDGTKIAYTVGCKHEGCYDSQHDKLENGDIDVMDADGSSRHALVASGSPEFAPDWGSSIVSCSGCGSGGGGGGGGGGGAYGHPRTVSFRIKPLSIVGKVASVDGTNACRTRVPVAVQRVQTLQYGVQEKDWRRGTLKTLTTTRLGRFHMRIHLAGDYRVVATQTTKSGKPCARAVSKVHEQDVVHDPRGDNHGPVDIQWASLKYRHHTVTAKVVAYQSFSSNNNPCIIVYQPGPNKHGAAIGCFRQVLCCTDGNGDGPPVTVTHPNARTIVFTSKIWEWKKMGFSRKYRFLSWTGWSRQSDEVLWDDAPDGCFAPGRTDKGCGTRLPVLTIPKSAF